MLGSPLPSLNAVASSLRQTSLLQTTGNKKKSCALSVVKSNRKGEVLLKNILLDFLGDRVPLGERAAGGVQTCKRRHVGRTYELLHRQPCHLRCQQSCASMRIVSRRGMTEVHRSKSAAGAGHGLQQDMGCSSSRKLGGGGGGISCTSFPQRGGSANVWLYKTGSQFELSFCLCSATDECGRLQTQCTHRFCASALLSNGTKTIVLLYIIN